MSTPRKKVPTPVNLSDGDNNPISVIAQARDIDGVIPISKGGSGLSKIEGGKLLASSESGAFFEEIDVNPHHLSGITENIQFQLDGFGKQLENVPRLYQVQIPVGDWENVDDGGLKKTLPVMGIKESDKPIVGLVLSSKDMDVIVNERIAFSNITIIDVW